MRRPPVLRPLEPRDGSAFESAFALIGWSKPRALFDRYLAEQAVGLRWTCVAEVNDAPTGYLTVAWRSADPELAARAIPEIVDLNVLPQHRRKGLGSSL
ncbi:MAG: GNAT family N-acetyltransferase, partial [Gemmatimonadota bacterium]